MKTRIIDYIKRNRVSTTEVADCLGKSGDIPAVKAVNRGKFSVGNVFWTYTWGESNWNVHKEAEDVQEGDIVLVHVFENEKRAIFGELVSKYIMLYRQANGIVVTGQLRDAQALIKENWSIWCTGFTPIGCFNECNDEEIDMAIVKRYREQYQGSIAVCDDSGVVIIPKEHHTKEFYQKLIAIELLEDIWFDCIDRKKMSTYETVCLKKYGNE